MFLSEPGLHRSRADRQGILKRLAARPAHGGQRFHFEPILVELERAMQLAQAVGQVLERQRGILKIDAARQSRVLERAMGFNVEVEVPCAVRSGSTVSASFRLMTHWPPYRAGACR